MQLHTYLIFDGDCRQAFEFYAKTLGGKITVMTTFGETPACGDMPPETHDKIMHARLEVGAYVVMGTDSTPMHPYTDINGAYVVADVKEPAEAERLFKALSENGKVEMPLQETFWAQRYAILTDRFGVKWMVNCALAG